MSRTGIAVSTRLVLLAVACIYLTGAYHFRWKNDLWKTAVHTDAHFYNRYLPMLFIGQKFDDPKENPNVIKYFGGTAICYSPFFAAAALTAKLAGEEISGYSAPFPIWISIGTIVYLVGGLYFFAKFLVRRKLKNWVINVSLLLLAGTTLLLHYGLFSPGWAHIPAFFVVCLLLYLIQLLSEKMTSARIALLFFLVSLLFFIRPTDVLILLIVPFLLKRHQSLFSVVREMLRKPVAIGLGIVLAFLPALFQGYLYFRGSGEWLVYSYTNEGFHFLKPEFIKVLFSVQKGLFVYTPFLPLFFFGIVSLIRHDRRLGIGVLLTLVVNTYVIVSWWCWNYGSTYGMRPFIEFYPLFFIAIAALLQRSGRFARGLIVAFGCLAITLNIIQTWQVQKGILDVDFKTTPKGYARTFLSFSHGNSGKYYRYPADESAGNVIRSYNWYNDIENPDTSWINFANRTHEQAHSGSWSTFADSTANFSTGIRIPAGAFPFGRNVLVRFSGWFFLVDRQSDAFVAMVAVANEKAVMYQSFPLKQFLDRFGKWEFKTFEVQMPHIPELTSAPDAHFEFYIFSDKSRIYADDLKIQFIRFRKMERPLDLTWE